MKKFAACIALTVLGLNYSYALAETSTKRATQKKPPVVQQETVGQRFDQFIATLKAQCETGKKLPGCSIAYLQPYNELATQVGSYAQNIQLPDQYPVNLYRPGMSSEEYFNTLCANEAGELIYKKVDNIFGIYQMRPRTVATEDVLQHLYAMEDPYGYQNWEATRPQDYFVQPPEGRYLFIETQGQQYRRNKDKKTNKFITVVTDGKSSKVPYLVEEKPITTPESKYGYIWRAIKRAKDRELGIAGSELIIIELDTNKVMAVRRGFVRGVAQNSPTGIWWAGGQRCPYGQNPETYTLDFIYRVLQPPKEQPDR